MKHDGLCDYAISENYTGEDYEKYQSFHSEFEQANHEWQSFGCACFWPLSPPPSSKNYIYMPGSGSGAWYHRYKMLKFGLIHPHEYLDAIEDAIDARRK